MERDPLYEALGTRQAPAARHGPRWLLAAVGVVGLVLVGVTLGTLTRRPDDQQVAIARIEPLRKPSEPSVPASPAPALPAAPPAPAAEGSIVTQPNGDTVEVQNGVKIIRMGAGRTALGQSSLQVPAADAAAVRLRTAPDPDLIEPSSFGPLPRVGSDGLRPADAYARPIASDAAATIAVPRVAVLVTGFGSDKSLAAQATGQLPEGVSFGFIPEAGAAGLVARARDAGHEVVLDASALTHATSQGAAGDTPADSLDWLHTAMGRLTGYTGVALAPRSPSGTDSAVRDIASRGLLAILTGPPTGGSSPSSGNGAASVLKPDVLVADGTAATIPDALRKLEAIARAKGSALGVIAASLQTVPALEEQLAAMAKRGTALVPVSAVAVRNNDAASAAP